MNEYAIPTQVENTFSYDYGRDINAKLLELGMDG